MDIGDITTFEAVIFWVIAGGGAMWASTKIMSKVKQDGWDEDVKTSVAFGIAAVLGIAAWGVGLAFNVIPQPSGDWREWVKGAVEAALAVIVGGKAWYARMKGNSQRTTKAA